MRRESLTFLALMGCILLVLGVIRIFNALYMSGLILQVFGSIPMQFGIIGMGKVVMWFTKKESNRPHL